MISTEELVRFLNLRKRIFECIEKKLEQDDHHESYEGRLFISYPGYFDDDPVKYILQCYLAPAEGREFVFYSLNKLESFIIDWEKELKVK